MVWEEAVESYEPRKVLQRPSDTEEDMQSNIDLLTNVLEGMMADLTPNAAKKLKMSHPEHNSHSMTLADVSRLTSQSNSGRSSVIDEGDR